MKRDTERLAWESPSDLETYMGSNETLNALQQQFIEGKTEPLFFDRLKVFAANVFKNKED